ncbi:MAG: GNAT family N-acetyltransferase [Cytophagales bacterium]
MIEVIQASMDSPDYQFCLEIRKKVFVDEQKVALEDEVDEFEKEARHFLARYNEQAVGAARWRELENYIKLERFAVLKEFRNKKIGSALVESVLKDIEEIIKKPAKLLLHSQLDAIPLYLKFGFEIEGEIFEECGILHKTMTRML